MRLSQSVDNYVTDKNPRAIDVDKTAQEARALMEKENVDYLIVLVNNVPTYVVKNFYLYDEDPQVKLGKLGKDGILDRVVLAVTGSSYPTALNNLLESKAGEIIVVNNLSDFRIYGTISPTTLNFGALQSSY